MLRFRVIVLALLSLTLLAMGGVVLLLGPDYVHKLATYPYGSPVGTEGWYSPRTVVAGDPGKEWQSRRLNSTERQFMDRFVDYAMAPGRRTQALIVISDGKMVLENYAEGRDADSVYNSMSKMKSVVAILLGIARDQGRILDFKESLVRYFPREFKDRPDLTIEQLLFMTSGLRNSKNQWNPFSDLARMHLSDRVADIAMNLPILVQPGRVFDYNNANSQILAKLLERVSGMDLPKLIEDWLWKPVGASNASIWTTDDGAVARAYCCLFARPKDWARVGQLVLDKGRSGSQALVSERFLDQWTEARGPNSRYGWHVWHDEVDAQGSKVHMLRMDGQGHNYVLVVPERGLVVVRSGEHPGPGWSRSQFVAPLLEIFPKRN